MQPALPSYDEAAALVSAFAIRVCEQSKARVVERVTLVEAAGRVLAQSIVASQDQPPFARSTRDGFACRAAQASTHRFLRLAGSTRAGEPPAKRLPSNAAWEIMTGGAVPDGSDAVAMLEHVEHRDASIRLLAPRCLEPGENMVAQGAQARRGDILLAPGAPFTFAQVALAAACGYSTVEVYRRPRVAILATGDELVDVDAEPGPGQIRNSNAPMLAALVASAGADPWILPRAADTPEALDEALALGTQANLLLISGGVSAGKFDLVEPALARRGARFHFTGVRMQPGKPLVFGVIPRPSNSHSKRMANSLPFFGLPGNPVSTAVTFLLFGAPMVAALAGSTSPSPRFALARLKDDTDRRTKPGLTRFLPATCTFSNSPNRVPEVALVPWQGSGDLAALARSNCFLMVPDEVGSLPAGTMVTILLY